MDSQGGAGQAQSKSELVGDDQSQVTGNAPDIRDKYEKIKNVFKVLIQECPYLIDDKAIERCEGKSLKEQFSIKIDSIRKSLGIEQMQDVSLLVDTMYDYQRVHDEMVAKKKQEVEEMDAEGNELAGEPANNEAKRAEQPAAGAAPGAPGNEAEEEEEEKDPNRLNLDLTLLVPALKAFHQKREDDYINKGAMAMGK